MRAEYLHRMVPLLLVLPEPNYHSTTKKVGSLKPGASCIANEDSSTGDNEVKRPEESCQQLSLELNDEEGKFLQPFTMLYGLVVNIGCLVQSHGYREILKGCRFRYRWAMA